MAKPFAVAKYRNAARDERVTVYMSAETAVQVRRELQELEAVAEGDLLAQLRDMLAQAETREVAPR